MSAIGPPAATPTDSVGEAIGLLWGMLRQGRYTKAETHARELLGHHRMTTEGDSIEAAYYLEALVQALWQGGKATEPETRALAEKAVQIRERTAPPDSFEVDKSLDRLAIVLAINGEYAAARPLYERALAIRIQNWGPEHNAVAACLNNLGNLHRDLGDYVKARALQEQSVAIWEKVAYPDPQSLALALRDLAGLHHDMGDDAGARELFERSVATMEAYVGPDHPELATSLHRLAQFYGSTADYTTALHYEERALAIQKKSIGVDNPDAALSLAGLGQWNRHLGRTEAARRQLEHALAIQEERLGPSHLQVASTLMSLAELALLRGDAAVARQVAERALGIRETILGPENPVVAGTLVALADILLASGDPRSAFEASLRAEAIGREHARLMAGALPEWHALRYTSVRASGLDIVLTLAVDHGAASDARVALDALIRSRALVLDEMAHRHRLGHSGDAELERLQRNHARACGQLANLTVRGPGEEEPARYRRLLDTVRKEKETSERSLAERSTAFRALASRAQVGLPEVAGALPPETALLSFALHGERPDPGVRRHARGSAATLEPGGRQYTAFVLRHGDSEPFACSIGTIAEIDTLVARWRLAAARGALQQGEAAAGVEADYQTCGDALRRRIWDPVAPRLRGIQRLFIVPDGALHLVTFAALPDTSAAYLLESGPLFHYLSTERDLVTAGRKPFRGKGLLCLGGPEFDASPASVELASAPREFGAGVEPAQAYRGSTSGCGDFQSLRFELLPGARQEAEEIAILWRQVQRRPLMPGHDLQSAGETPGVPEEVVQLLGSAASEAAFKALAPGKRVLHLATHGFFLDGHCPSALASTRGVGGFKAEATTPPALTGENPLLLTGLALASVNRRRAAGPDDEDGVLTAEEIAALDLEGVQWAVLSACDTGLGQVEAGEGVMGLRRAFQVAGVGTVIHSLWPVGDESTRQWMRALYQARLLDGLDTAACVRVASLQLLHAQREAGKNTHPFHWGGFVAAGDWN